MKCTVTIDNEIDDKLVLCGLLDVVKDGFSVFYNLDGDECRFSYTGDMLIQTRRGAVDLTLIFKTGKETECTLMSGGLSGSFTVFTDKLHIINDENGIFVNLNYVLAGENRTLNFKAEIIRE